MARMTIGKGVDNFIAMSDNLKYRVSGLSGRALYVGAKVMADALKQELEGLPTSPGKTKAGVMRNPTQVEKDGLIAGMGIAHKRTEGGSSNITIGFDGFNADATERWPSGKPNSMIARSINKGTSFMRRIPFANNVKKRTKEAAESAMIEELDKQLKEIIGDNG